MPNTPREFVPDKPVFVTALCHDRRPLLALPDRKALLLGILRELKSTIPFNMVGYVILDDHFHLLLEPGQADDVPLLIHAAKTRFARRIKRPDDPGAFNVWQKNYRDHIIQDENDFDRHLDFIHYDPVLHGLVKDPVRYAWSSFRVFFVKGSYPENWGVDAPPRGIEGISSE